MELAEYEQLTEIVVSTAADIEQALFGPQPVAACLVAECEPAHSCEVASHSASASHSPGSTVLPGVALYFRNFSTFVGRPGIYLEDLYVQPAYRGRGIGKALLLKLAQIAVERGYGRVEWSVLDWNQPSIEFYQSLGARPMSEWTVYRLDGAALQHLGQSPLAS